MACSAQASDEQPVQIERVIKALDAVAFILDNVDQSVCHLVVRWQVMWRLGDTLLELKSIVQI
jgi:hypothetical protein